MGECRKAHADRDKKRKLEKMKCSIGKGGVQGQQTHGVVVRRGLWKVFGEGPPQEKSKDSGLGKVGKGSGGLLRTLPRDSQRAMPRVDPEFGLNMPNTVPWSLNR